MTQQQTAYQLYYNTTNGLITYDVSSGGIGAQSFQDVTAIGASTNINIYIGDGSNNIVSEYNTSSDYSRWTFTNIDSLFVVE